MANKVKKTVDKKKDNNVKKNSKEVNASNKVKINSNVKKKTNLKTNKNVKKKIETKEINEVKNKSTQKLEVKKDIIEKKESVTKPKIKKEDSVVIEKKDEKKKYYKNLDIIRIFSCLAILLYHLNILKGGFFLVSTFFIISAYLSVISAFKQNKFSFKEYYLKRIKGIYLPLLTVVFITIAFLSLFPNISLINLKNETTSIIFSYNNFWQLNANMDYFKRFINSPFIHLWYISILIQFEIVFPFIFLGLKKIGEKTKKIVAPLLSFLLGVLSLIYFVKLNMNGNIMMSYYNTFARSFSLFFGISLGFTHYYYGSYMPEKLRDKKISNIIYYIYLILLFMVTLLVSAKSKFFVLAMIVVNIISIRLIDYATLTISNKENLIDKIIKKLASICYEIYLVQYVVIYFMQYTALEKCTQVIIVATLCLVISFILHYLLDFKKNKYDLFKNILRIVLLAAMIYGFYLYVTSKDYTKEMKELESQLSQNESLMSERQEAYFKNKEKEDEMWNNILSDLDDVETKVNEMVKNAKITGIGDSVMLGAVPNLYEEFTKGYFDAKVSRTAWSVEGILTDLINKGILGDIVVLHLGTNGDCSMTCKENIMSKLEGKKVFWLTVTNDEDVNFNEKIKSFVSNYDNAGIIDWNALSNGKSEYFYSDGIHLTPDGRKAYVNVLKDEVYKIYLEEYNKKKEEIIKKHEEELKTKIVFYGNDLLLNSLDLLSKDFETSKFNINKEYTFDSLKNDLENAINNDTLDYNVVLMLDKTNLLTRSEVSELVKLLKNHKLYIVNMSKQTTNLYRDATVLDFYTEIMNHDDYLLVDQIHLTNAGNEALINFIKEKLTLE